MRLRKAGPALLWRDDRLTSELVEELVDTLNDPSTPKGPQHPVLRLAERLAKGQRPFRGPRRPASAEGAALVLRDGEITSWQPPTVRVTADEHGRLRWELEPDPREKLRRLTTALALVAESDALRGRFKRCPACRAYFLADRKDARHCSPPCRWMATKRETRRRSR